MPASGRGSASAVGFRSSGQLSDHGFRTIQARAKDLPVPSRATSACGKLASAGSEGEPMPDVRRRELIALLGGAAAAWPLAARGQQPTIPLVGFLNWGSARLSGRVVAAFRGGLAEVGYVEPQSVSVELRWADTQSERLPALAAELVQRKVAVIVAGGFGGPIFAAKAATSTIPIVFAYGGDPVKNGLVTRLNRPEGNITGVTAFNAELVSKWLSLVGDLVPQATTVAFLSTDSSYTEDQKSQMFAAARALGR